MQKVIVSVFVIVLMVGAGYFIYEIQSPKNQIEILQPPIINTVATSTSDAVVEPAPGPSIAVQWSTPKEVSKIDIFDSTNEFKRENYDFHVYQVGKVASGQYEGGIVLSATSPSDGIGNNIYRFIQHQGKLVLITKHSNELYDFDDIDRNKITIDSSSEFSDLLFPANITYGDINFRLESYNAYTTVLFSEEHKMQDLRVAFIDPKWGTVYMDTPGKSSTPKRGGFYMKAPDGTTRDYSMDIYFHNDKIHLPAVTWIDGTANTAEYTHVDVGGCGSRNFLSVQYDLTKNDLVPIGTTFRNEPIYQLKNLNHPLLQKMYATDYNPYDAPKVSYNIFVQSKPVFFWIDSFGRIIKFQNFQFIPQAECGKPVIYLYPEKTTEVSVKLAPKGGFTKSEPAYNNGWLVKATPKGVLTEISSGNVYPYLFWEGRGGIYTTPKKGFVVEAKNVHSFLVEKLTKLGLNAQEQKDFMEFWEPRMTGSPYFFVTFLGNREMDEIAPLTISPKPDTVIRILMDFKPLRKPINVEGFDIRTPARNGFTVVEWGGVLQ